MANVLHKMRIFDRNGQRLYLDNFERKRFIEASKEESREDRMFCRILHDTGCRPSEALDLTAENIMLSEMNIQFRSLKKRKFDKQGNIKDPEYRLVPVHEKLIDLLDLTFDLKKVQQNQRDKKQKLFIQSRPTAYRMVKRVMERAKIKGKMATAKGLRHGFAIALLMGEKPAPIHIVAQVLGHSDVSTTEIYLQAVGTEKRTLVLQALE